MIRKSLLKLTLAATGLALSVSLSTPEAALGITCSRACQIDHQNCTAGCHATPQPPANLAYCLDTCDSDLFFCQALCDNP